MQVVGARARIAWATPAAALLAGAAVPALLAQEPVATRPEALTALEQARAGLLSGRIEWSVLPQGDENKALFFVSRYASNGDLIFENRGDREGWTRFDWETGKGLSRYPQLYMVNADGVWYFKETDLSCQVAREGNARWSWEQEMRDVRAMGLTSFSSSMEYTRGIASIWGSAGDPVVEWRTDIEDDLHVVVARRRSGASVTWHINPARGWNAERVEFDDGTERWTAVSSLAQFGETWFPQETRYYRNDELQEVIQVRTASFNNPEDPPRFTPKDLGVEPGCNIVPQGPGPRPQGPDALTWNGDNAVPHREWVDDLRSGRRQPGPNIRRAYDRGYLESPYDTPEELARRELAYRQRMIRSRSERHVGLWERYVRQFIERYRLDREQADRAWAIFRECRRRADEYIQRRRDRFTELISQMLAARKAGQNEKAEELASQVQRLCEPIDRIFEESLKPRLEKLPTRAQRAAAEAAPASPAAQGSGG
jgi:hypothetical protein